MHQQNLKALYDGRIRPGERRVPQDAESQKSATALGKAEQAFLFLLSKQQAAAFDAYKAAALDADFQGDHSLFSHAFSLGLLLALDVLEEASLVIEE